MNLEVNLEVNIKEFIEEFSIMGLNFCSLQGLYPGFSD